MKYFASLIFCFLSISVSSAQDINILLKEAENFEKRQQETEALDKYKQVLTIEPANLKALVKAAELHVALGGRSVDKNTRRLYYETGLAYARRALQANGNQADGNRANAAYVMALASDRMADVETENKKIVLYLKDVKRYADSALLLHADHAKASYMLGKWHYDIVTLSGIKKTAVKLFYGGLPEVNMESAIQYLEKCKKLEPYFVANYLALAKAYKENRQPTLAIETLTRLIKLPTRTGDDVTLKAEGARLLELWQ